MRFLLDHDVPDDIVFALRALDHEVLKLREVMSATATDEELFGSIPASAGKPCCRSPRCGLWTVDPRERGETTVRC